MKKLVPKKKMTLETVALKVDNLTTNVDNLTIATKKGFEGTASKKDLASSIDELARITKQGFDNTVSKEEFKEFKDEMYVFKKNTERVLFAMDSKLETSDKRLDAIDKALGPLVVTASVMQKEIRDHGMRLERLEQKVGLK